MQESGLEPPVVREADELLEAEDLLEILDAGIISMTVLDDYKAEFWSDVFPGIVVRRLTQQSRRAASSQRL